MRYRLLADLAVTLHLGFLLFTVLGGFLVFRWRWFAWIHLPAAIWGGFVEVAGRICPLTVFENWLRRAGGGSAESDFIDRYVMPIEYPSGLTRDSGSPRSALIVVNSVIYVMAWCYRTSVER
jgi:hypothetical protein